MVSTEHWLVAGGTGAICRSGTGRHMLVGGRASYAGREPGAICLPQCPKGTFQGEGGFWVNCLQLTQKSEEVAS